MKKKIFNKQLIVLLLTCIVFSFLMCFSPFAQGHGHGYDQAIYSAIGNAINKGRVLYTGIVDNKGPLMYFIDAFGLLINYKFGIFLIEFIFLYVGSIFAYKTALLITKNNKWLSCFSVIFSMLLLVYTLDGGNYTEEYAILFTNIATYFVIKFLVNNYKLSWYELMIIGMCFAATFLLRANLCAFFVSQILVTLICLIKDKEFKILFRSMGYILLGIIIFLIPFLIYFISTNSLTECLNLVYFNVVNSFGKISLMERFEKTKGLISISNNSNVFTVSLLSFLVFLTKPKMEKSTKRILIITYIGLLINLYVNSLTGGQAWAYTHYFISFVPIIIIVSSWFFSHVYRNITDLKVSSEIKILAIIFLAFLIIAKPTKDLFVTAATRYNPHEQIPSGIEKYIIDNTTEEDTIQMIGVNETIYYPTNRIPTSKHLYFVGGFEESRRKKDANELANDLYNAKEPAKLIMFSKEDINDQTFTNSLSDKNKFIDFLNNKYIYDKENSEKFNLNIYILN